MSKGHFLAQLAQWPSKDRRSFLDHFWGQLVQWPSKDCRSFLDHFWGQKTNPDQLGNLLNKKHTPMGYQNGVPKVEHKKGNLKLFLSLF